VDADLADYFGSIPHAELLKSVARRIVDRSVLHLIKMWLDCPVEETDDRRRKTLTTEVRDKRRGIRSFFSTAKKQGWNIINGLTQDPSGLAKSLRLS
jgi:retron-type reverse transcriptase